MFSFFFLFLKPKQEFFLYCFEFFVSFYHSLFQLSIYHFPSALFPQCRRMTIRVICGFSYNKKNKKKFKKEDNGKHFHDYYFIIIFHSFLRFRQFKIHVLIHEEGWITFFLNTKDKPSVLFNSKSITFDILKILKIKIRKDNS